MNDTDFTTQQKILHSPFDINTHIKHFVNYFEVCILPDGTVEYAVPSHTEYVIKKYMEKHKCTREDIYAKYFNMYDIAKDLNIVLCWSETVYYEFKLTQEQFNVLTILKKYGLIPDEEYN
jgi:hypothetical protein